MISLDLAESLGSQRLAGLFSGSSPFSLSYFGSLASNRSLRPDLVSTGLSQDDGLASGPIVSTAGDGWRLVEQFSAHHALILKVETERLWAAKSITQELIEPVISSYNEVLVYFYLTTEKNSLPVRRVQWTKEGGYVEMDLRE